MEHPSSLRERKRSFRCHLCKQRTGRRGTPLKQKHTPQNRCPPAPAHGKARRKLGYRLRERKRNCRRHLCKERIRRGGNAPKQKHTSRNRGHAAPGHGKAGRKLRYRRLMPNALKTRQQPRRRSLRRTTVRHPFASCHWQDPLKAYPDVFSYDPPLLSEQI